MLQLSERSMGWIKSQTRFSFQDREKFFRYFFLGVDFEKVNVSIFDIQDTDIKTENKKINIMLCVENCNYWRHYEHFNKHGSYGNDAIKIYFYNHIDKCVFTEKYAAIPVIYTQLTYFKAFYDSIIPRPLSCPKNFCLIATSITNEAKQKVISKLSKLGECHMLETYKTLVGDKSCYHSQELINLFNRFKFVFVSENSFQAGYITEKIFNCLFARTVPIYLGAPDISRYFNTERFIEVKTDDDMEKVRILDRDASLYQKCIESRILNNYDDENYLEKLNAFIHANGSLE